jgi:hypothetical protein
MRCRPEPGKADAGYSLQELTSSTPVEEQKAAGTVTLQGPTGTTTIKVRDPRNLERVAVGDLIEITYTEAVAASVEPPVKH